MVRRIALPPASRPPIRPIPSLTKAPSDVQEYSTITKVALYILGAIAVLYVIGLVHRIVTKLQAECDQQAEKCCRVGLQHLQANRVDEARKAFEEALSWNPSTEASQIQIYVGLGRVCTDPKKAKDYFTQAREIGSRALKNPYKLSDPSSIYFIYPDLSLACLHRGKIRESEKDYKGALQDLKDALSLNVPSHRKTILFAESRVYFLSGDLQMATQKCQEALKDKQGPATTLEELTLALRLIKERDGPYADLLRERAAIYATQKKYPEAEADLNQALTCKVGPEHQAAILIDWAQTYLLSGKRKEALEKCEEALKVAKDPENIVACLEFELEVLQEKDKKYADVLLQIANTYFRQKNFPKGLEALNRALNECTLSQLEKGQLLAQRFKVHMAKQDEEAAKKDLASSLTCFESALTSLKKEDEPFVDLLCQIAEVCVIQRNFPKALQALSRALNEGQMKDLVRGQLHSQRAEVHFENKAEEAARKDLESSLACFESALKGLSTKKEDYAKILRQKATSLAHLGKFDDALRDLNTALTECEITREHKSAILRAMSEICATARDQQSAERKCDEALKEAQTPQGKLLCLELALKLRGEHKDDKSAEILRQMAEIYYNLEEYLEALETLNVALEQCKGISGYLSARLLKNRAMNYIQLSKPELALKDLEKASQIEYVDQDGLKESVRTSLAQLKTQLAQKTAPTNGRRDVAPRALPPPSAPIAQVNPPLRLPGGSPASLPAATAVNPPAQNGAGRVAAPIAPPRQTALVDEDDPD